MTCWYRPWATPGRTLLLPLGALTALVLGQPLALLAHTPALASAAAVPRVAPRHTPAAQPVAPDAAARAAITEAYARLPLRFEANLGQSDPRVRFLARGSGYSLFLTPSEAVLSLSDAVAQQDRRPATPRGARVSPSPTARTRAVVRMQVEGANAGGQVVGEARLPGVSNYLLGKDPARWRTSVPAYARVRYREVYPGVDQVWYGNQGQLEYDFVVAPGADPRAISLRFDGAERVEADGEGGLVLHTLVGELRQHAPAVYQETSRGRQRVVSRYELRGGGRIGLELGTYDGSTPLVIDPTLVYSTFLGGSGFEFSADIAVDGTGAAYVAGQTTSTDFPTENAFDATFDGEHSDAFVTKLSADGSALVYSTYLGGFGPDNGEGIAVDASGAAYVTGGTATLDFPTQNAFDNTFNGGDGDAFVTKLSADGSALVYSTYLGGFNVDEGHGIAVDETGAAFVTGITGSSEFPTQNAFDATYNSPGSFGLDAFVTKLSADGSALVYSTFLGGSGLDYGDGIAVDSSGAAYIAGRTDSSDFPTQNAFDATFDGEHSDAFVTKLSADGSALVYSTYLGGSDTDAFSGVAIAVDTSGAAYVTAQTSSIDFPTQNAFDGTLDGVNDAFVTKLSPDGSTLVYSTYLGGSAGEGSFIRYGIAVDGTGAAYVTGTTFSSDFPTRNAFDATFDGSSDAFVTKLSADGSALVYSTLLGGSTGDGGVGIAVDSSGAAYVTGLTDSSDFPTRNAFDDTFNGIGIIEDAFVTKLGAAGSDTPGVVVPATSQFFLRNALAPGPADLSFGYGPDGSGWIPLAGDWDGDGDDTPGLYNPATGTFFLKDSNAGGAADRVYGFGPDGAGWSPIAGDWDGDGTDTVGLFDPVTGTFFLRNAHAGGAADLVYGFGPDGAGWSPIAGDWDGDGTDTVGLFAPATSRFFLRNVHAPGAADLAYGFGPAGSGWVALAGDWDGDGVDTVGLYAPSSRYFFLRDEHAGGAADHVFSFGPLGVTPLVGDWDGP